MKRRETDLPVPEHFREQFREPCRENFRVPLALASHLGMHPNSLPNTTALPPLTHLFDSALARLLALPAHPAHSQRTLNSLAPSLGQGFSPPRLAVAFSGGTDSLALLALTADWAQRKHAPPPLALVVNHSLTADSAHRATQAQELAHALGVAAKILSSTDSTDSIKPKAEPAYGEAALHKHGEAVLRRHRYALLESACRQEGLLFLLLAHQQDDLLETYRLRVARGSSPFGLAGISVVRDLAELRLLRPLLATPRTALEDHLVQTGLQAVEDPTNAALVPNPRSTKGTSGTKNTKNTNRNQRVQLRINLARLPAYERKRILNHELKAVHCAAQVRAQREQQAADLGRHLAKLSPYGFATLENVSALTSAQVDIRVLVLRALFQAIGGTAPTPEALRPLATLLAASAQGDSEENKGEENKGEENKGEENKGEETKGEKVEKGGKTEKNKTGRGNKMGSEEKPTPSTPTCLAGCRLILPVKQNAPFLVVRESARLAPAPAQAGYQVWDKRFAITLPHSNPYTQIAPYTGTAKAVRQLVRQQKNTDLYPTAALPAVVLNSLPVLLKADDSPSDPQLLVQTLLMLTENLELTKNSKDKKSTTTRQIRFLPSPPPFSAPFVPFFVCRFLP